MSWLCARYSRPPQAQQFDETVAQALNSDQPATDDGEPVEGRLAAAAQGRAIDWHLSAW